MVDATVPQAEVMTVSVSSRIPEFWVDQPRVWFVRAEAVLTPQKMGDESRFDMIVSKLPKEVIVQITDFLVAPPATGKYEALKIKLLTLLEDTKDRQIERMMVEMELGEQKASQLLRRMKDLGRDKFPEDTIRVLWQRLLPATVRAVLSATQTNNLDQLAAVADNVLEATRSGQIAAVSQTTGGTHNEGNTATANTQTDTEKIMSEIAKLSVRLKDVERPRSGFRGVPPELVPALSWRGGSVAVVAETHGEAKRNLGGGRSSRLLRFKPTTSGPIVAVPRVPPVAASQLGGPRCLMGGIAAECGGPRWGGVSVWLRPFSLTFRGLNGAATVRWRTRWGRRGRGVSVFRCRSPCPLRPKSGLVTGPLT